MSNDTCAEPSICLRLTSRRQVLFCPLSKIWNLGKPPCGCVDWNFMDFIELRIGSLLQMTHRAFIYPVSLGPRALSISGSLLQLFLSAIDWRDRKGGGVTVLTAKVKDILHK